MIRQEEERRRREEEMMIRQREMEEQMRRQREENYSRMGYMDPVSEIMMFFGYITMFRNFFICFQDRCVWLPLCYIMGCLCVGEMVVVSCTYALSPERYGFQ